MSMDIWVHNIRRCQVTNWGMFCREKGGTLADPFKSLPGQ